MNLNITGRNFDITSAIRDYTEEKITRLSRFLNSGSDALVILSVEKYRHRVEVLIKSNGLLIQAESITGEMYSAIDEVSEKLDRQIRKYKDKLTCRRKDVKKSIVSEEPSDTLPPDTLDSFRIIKKKKFTMKPMCSEEAAMQMELLDKEFFVFTNDQSGDINVIYKRKDGDFGLIEPMK